LSALFGKGVKLAGSPPNQVTLKADLDGDKSADDIFLVVVDGKPSAAVQIVNFNSPAPLKGLAVAVVRHPAKGSAVPYLLCGGSFFDTPTWKLGKYHDLLGVGHGPKPPSDARGTSIRLFTESGANYYLHWNGKTFIASSEGDEP
jgi:hypothetical protein